jgi:hypothetical protein
MRLADGDNLGGYACPTENGSFGEAIGVLDLLDR